ncbi:2Fe-2S iron-sulfur cluster-binding protein [Sodalis sp.]
MPYSCLASICDTCKVKLLSDDVAPLTGSATAAVCGSCLTIIPRGDVHLE